MSDEIEIAAALRERVRRFEDEGDAAGVLDPAVDAELAAIDPHDTASQLAAASVRWHRGHLSEDGEEIRAALDLFVTLYRGDPAVVPEPIKEVIRSVRAPLEWFSTVVGDLIERDPHEAALLAQRAVDTGEQGDKDRRRAWAGPATRTRPAMVGAEPGDPVVADAADALGPDSAAGGSSSSGRPPERATRPAQRAGTRCGRAEPPSVTAAANAGVS